MKEKLIKNFDELATTENRGLALEIMEAGLSAINTKKALSSSVSLSGDILSIQGKEFDLNKFKNIKVVGFGKSSCEAALALEKILGNRIERGVVIGVQKTSCKYVEIFFGSHPRPSEINIEAGRKIYEIANKSTEDDLIIALVSGGGSAMLCYPESECAEGVKLYNSFLGSGKTIAEINTVRKHLSLFKGGGLAKIAYPATVIGLIFSDVPGDAFENVASGPTYMDKTTVGDAKRVAQENNLGNFDFIETPKDGKYFDKVHNFVLVSNKTALVAIAEKAESLGFEANVISAELYDSPDQILEKVFSMKKENSVVLAAGEPSIEVKGASGKGGRNLHLGLMALIKMRKDRSSVFVSFASDGMDNSDVAGAVVDKETIKKTEELNLDANGYLKRFDSYEFFRKTGDAIITGPTGANVSDLMILLNKN